jgi:hypothetical protein
MERALILFAVAAAGLAAPAGAKQQLDNNLTAAIACTKVAEAQARLACFDRAMVGLNKAVKAGTLNIGSDSPLALTGTIAAAGASGFNRFWVVMANGDRWNMQAGSAFDEGPRKGAKVTINRAPLSGYWFMEEGAPDRRATFKGRSSD